MWRPLSFIFENGRLAVELFFTISGLCIYYNYEVRIIDRQITFEDFIVKHIRKLYPLYFITFIVVSLLQAILWIQTGEVYGHQAVNVANFILGILGASSGIISSDVSFNGPAWTLMSEMLCYVMFFCVFRLFKEISRAQELLVSIVIVILSQTIIPTLQIPILNSVTSRGIKSFFIGVIIAVLQTQELSEQTRRALSVICAGILMAISLVVLGIQTSNIIVTDEYGLACYIIVPLVVTLVLNCKTLSKILDMKLFKVLGHASYDIYLWHFPLQLLFIAVNVLIKTISFINYWILLVYFVAAVIIGIISGKIREKVQNKKGYLKKEF